MKTLNTHAHLPHFQWLMRHVACMCTPLSGSTNTPLTKPVNLLFSLDQFVFEFSKKSRNQKKHGEFFHQLRERKKLSLFYGGVSRKHIGTLITQAEKAQGGVSKNMVFLLERRLDVVLQRSGFSRTLCQARHHIAHQKVLVNDQLVSSPGYGLSPGDVVSFVPAFRHHLATFSKSPQVIPEKKPTGCHLSKNTCERFFEWMSTQIQTGTCLKKQGVLFWRYGFKKTRVSQSFQAPHRRKAPDALGRAWCVLLEKSVGCSQKSGRFFHLTRLGKGSPRSRLDLITPLKPLHLEISYKLARVVYLYAPQRLSFPFLLDLDLVRRSFS